MLLFVFKERMKGLVILAMSTGDRALLWERRGNRITGLQNALGLTWNEGAVLQALEAAGSEGLLGLPRVGSQALVGPTVTENAIDVLMKRALVVTEESEGGTLYIFTGS